MTKKLIDNRYIICEIIGEGSMGIVYLCKDIIKDNKILALKTIKKSALKHSFTIVNFKNEFSAMKKLKHPNLLTVYDFGFDKNSDNLYITMEYIEGKPLSDLIKKNYLDIDITMEIIVQICRTMEFVHSRNILHRDIKPSNIILCSDESKIKLMDFGLSELKLESKNRKGSPLYISPENFYIGEVDSKSDQFSLGLTFFELITNKPFYSEINDYLSFVKIMKSECEYNNYLEKKFLDIKNIKLSEIIRKMISYHGKDRFNSFLEIIDKINSLGINKYQYETDNSRKAYIVGAPFIGREMELNKLENFLNQDECSKLLIIKGEIGVGKDKLINEFKNNCQLNKIIFYEATCLSYIDRLYTPFLKILNMLILNDSEEYINEYGQFLKPILPRNKRLENIKIEYKINNEILLNKISEYIVKSLEKNKYKAVVLIKNFQWIDEISFELLNYILEKSPFRNIRFYITVQSSDYNLVKNKIKTIIEKTEIIELENFNLQETKSYLNSIFGNKYQDTFNNTDLIQKISKGNPLFLKNLINYFIFKKEIIKNNNFFWEFIKKLSIKDIPNNIKTIINKNFEFLNLNKSNFELLKYLSLISRSIDLNELSNIIENNNELKISIEKLVWNEILISEIIDNKFTYKFYHHLIENIIKNSIKTEEKQRLHKNIAISLEKIHRNNLDEYIDELSYHFDNAEMQEKAGHYLNEAGDIAYINLKFENAILKYENALTKNPDLYLKEKIFNRLAKAYHYCGEKDKALKLLENALSVNKKRLLNPDLTTADILHDLSAFYFLIDKINISEKYQLQAIDIRERVDKKSLILSFSLMANLAIKNQDYDKALYFLKKGEILAEENKDTQKLDINYYIGSIYNNFAKLYSRKNEKERELKYYFKVIDIYKKFYFYNYIPISSIYNNIGNYYIENGDYKKALFFLKKSLNMKIKILGENNYKLAPTFDSLGELYTKTGEFNKALNYFEKAELLFLKNKNISKSLILTLLNKAIVYKYQKRYDELFDLLNKIYIMSEKNSFLYYQVLSLYELSELYFRKNEFNKAQIEINKTLELSKNIDDEILFNIEILSLSIDYRLTKDITIKNNIISTLKTKISKTNNIKKNAKIYYAIFCLLKNEENL